VTQSLPALPRTLVVVGMRREAALLPAGTRIIVTGGEPRRAVALLDAEALPAAEAGGVAAVLSFGIAGGLAPELRSGDLVVASRVRGPGGAWPADPAWAAALARATGARLGMLAGAPRVVADAAAKRQLHAATGGALAVDLESEAAAAFAAAHGLPFAALRAVADTAEDSIPAAAARGLSLSGRPAVARVALGLLRRPQELPAVLELARRTRLALESLRRAAASLPAG
jgi:hopanoid-associated phosphorylase